MKRATSAAVVQIPAGACLGFWLFGLRGLLLAPRELPTHANRPVGSVVNAELS